LIKQLNSWQAANPLCDRCWADAAGTVPEQRSCPSVAHLTISGCETIIFAPGARYVLEFARHAASAMSHMRRHDGPRDQAKDGRYGDLPRAPALRVASSGAPAGNRAARVEGAARDLTGPRYPRFLEMLGTEDRNLLLARAIKRSIRKGQLLYHQGDASEHVFIVLRGIIRIHYLSGDGHSLTTMYYREGMVVGAHGCTEWSGNHSWSAESAVDSQVLCLRRVDLIALTDSSLPALKCLMAVAEFKAEQLKRVIKILATPKLEERILIALRTIGEVYGVQREDGIEIGNQFTRQEIAEMMGASRQSVTMLMLGLEKSGHIRREGRKIFICAEAGEMLRAAE
jgi:CRP/FNR family transcriptional regulator, cyclic AMP receptor protein